jgi:hypothetical protein
VRAERSASAVAVVGRGGTRDSTGDETRGSKRRMQCGQRQDARREQRQGSGDALICGALLASLQTRGAPGRGMMIGKGRVLRLTKAHIR